MIGTNTKNPKGILKEIFGYDDFRDSQAAIIDDVIAGKDVLAVMATGGGKSLCFQIPALCMPGVCIVVSPLISLMKDQVDALKRKGVGAGLLNSSLTGAEILKTYEDLSKGSIKLLYVSPERMCTDDFIEVLKGLNISFFAIDEAHCVSTWGHDFRLSFTKIHQVIKDVEHAQNKNFSKAAFTATATPFIREDICKQLDMADPSIFVGSFDRPNIELNVRKELSKNAALLDILNHSNSEPTIIYTATVKAADSLYNLVASEGFSVGLYHGRLETNVKSQMQNKFLSNEVQIMIATNAFGMGVDKPDVRNVIHYQMPANLENYYQEAGRAGRDGKPSRAILLFNDRDRGLQEFFINMSFPSESAVRAIQLSIAAMSGGHSINIDKDLLSQVAPDVVPENQIESIIRILESNGVLKINNLDNVYDGCFAIEPLELYKDLDLEYLKLRRNVVASNLNAMERFCKTQMCRRTNILRYFEEKTDCASCGTCDVCIANEYNNAKISNVIPQETLKCLLSTIYDHESRFNENMIKDILLGVNNSTIRRRELDQYEHFGAMKALSKNDLSQLIEKCISEQLIVRSNRNPLDLIITESGSKVIDGEKFKSILASAISSGAVDGVKSESDQPISRVTRTNDVFDSALHNKLNEYRNFLAEKYNKPAFMIFTDKTLKLLASTVPSGSKDLELLGLSPKRVNLFGENLIRVINNYHNKSKEIKATDDELTI